MKVKVTVPASVWEFDIPMKICEIQEKWVRDSYIRREIKHLLEDQIDWEWVEIKENGSNL